MSDVLTSSTRTYSAGSPSSNIFNIGSHTIQTGEKVIITSDTGDLPENIVAHTKSLGYRNYDTPDNSTNVWWMMFFGWGSGALHNNHHRSPSKFSFRHKWWEIDLGMIFIPLLWITGSKTK
jgi:hypothetical protein